jgi:ribonuclease HII
MKLPDFKQEEHLISRNKSAVGLDEAGRGPLAGPVVAGAVYIKESFFPKDFPEKNLIRDSKTLSSKQRNEVFDFINQSEEIFFKTVEISALTIDKINVLNASLLAMRMAAENLIRDVLPEENKKEACLLVDGNALIPKISFDQKNFPKGDADVFSIAAASICAKVWRDKLMEKFDKQYPGYGFARHKGYGTKEHLLKLKEFGPCDIHRRSFRPVKECGAR